MSLPNGPKVLCAFQSVGGSGTGIFTTQERLPERWRPHRNDWVWHIPSGLMARLPQIRWLQVAPCRKHIFIPCCGLYSRSMAQRAVAMTSWVVDLAPVPGISWGLPGKASLITFSCLVPRSGHLLLLSYPKDTGFLGPFFLWQCCHSDGSWFGWNIRGATIKNLVAPWFWAKHDKATGGWLRWAGHLDSIITRAWNSRSGSPSWSLGFSLWSTVTERIISSWHSYQPSSIRIEIASVFPPVRGPSIPFP